MLALCKADYSVSFPELRDDTWDREQAEASEPGDIDDQPYLVQRAETLQMILYQERGALAPETTMAAWGEECVAWHAPMDSASQRPVAWTPTILWSHEIWLAEYGW